MLAHMYVGGNDLSIERNILGNTDLVTIVGTEHPEADPKLIVGYRDDAAAVR